MEVTTKTEYLSRRIVGPNGRASAVNQVYDIKEEVTRWCCDDMREAWGKDYGQNQYIGFGEYEYGLNRDRNVNIYHCSPWPEGAAWHKLAIRFCPFCAERIIIDGKPAGGEECPA